MDIMEKEVFVGAKREKRGQRFFVKKRHVCSSQKFTSKRFERFLSLSLFLSSLFLSLCYCIRLSSERARCAVEADKTSTRASIRALLASSHRRRNNMEEEEEETLTETRTTRTTIESLERDVEVRRLATFSLSFELENALSLSLARALF